MNIPINYNHHEATWNEIAEFMHLSHEISQKASAKREIAVAKVPTLNPRTYVKRIVRPTKVCRFTKRFISSVDLDHKSLKMCCGKIKVNSETIIYVHRFDNNKLLG